MKVHTDEGGIKDQSLTRFSQQREEIPLLSLTIHLPPFLLASSCMQTMNIIILIKYYIIVISYLPHWLDSHFKQMYIGMRWEI